MGTQRYSKTDRRHGNQLIRAFAALAVVNFIAFVATALYLGGDAINGTARAGHYFLGLHGNGPFTEVSHAIFTYSLWHTYSVILSILLVMAAAAWRRFGPLQS
jgi:hypothetical protein